MQAVGVTVKDRQRVLAYGRTDGGFEADLEEELSASEQEEHEASWGEQLNVTKDRTIGARYSDARLPARVPLIFTTNIGMPRSYIPAELQELILGSRKGGHFQPGIGAPRARTTAPGPHSS